MGCNLEEPRTPSPKLPVGKTGSNTTYTIGAPKGSVITYRGQRKEELKTGEWSLPFFALPRTWSPLLDRKPGSGPEDRWEKGCPSRGHVHPPLCQAPRARGDRGWQTQQQTLLGGGLAGPSRKSSSPWGGRDKDQRRRGQGSGGLPQMSMLRWGLCSPRGRALPQTHTL